MCINIAVVCRESGMSKHPATPLLIHRCGDVWYSWTVCDTYAELRVVDWEIENAATRGELSWNGRRYRREERHGGMSEILMRVGLIY